MSEAFLRDKLKSDVEKITENIQKFHAQREKEIFRESEKLIRAKKERQEQLQAAERIQAEREKKARLEQEKKAARGEMK